jgi:hypothetical protein
MIKKMTHKQGDSFDVEANYTDEKGDPIDITDYIISSQIRGYTGNLVDTLVYSAIDSKQGSYRLFSNSTYSWPIGLVLWDIKYSTGTKIVHSETINITVEKTQTL